MDDPTRSNDLRTRQIEAANIYMKHIYTIFIGLRACSELRTEQADASFLTSVSVEDGRKALHAIDAAARRIGINVVSLWSEAAPRAIVTAEALKREPRRHLAICQRMGSLFRSDEANLQNLLAMLGSHEPLIPKDF